MTKRKDATLTERQFFIVKYILKKVTFQKKRELPCAGINTKAHPEMRFRLRAI